ncbi:hypothetical protein HHK36_007519 [Tetracentron sinense]|uniref:Gamma-butyrobetaine hydroxylase-like N-terminal domain-containing protein n=1 Tax=Tetracentron sinense TaxID=13715 RepID=A0A834ZMS1_TETSI|nr:hypothetical protein HHK36_007519 [Tetracentron sinense]
MFAMLRNIHASVQSLSPRLTRLSLHPPKTFASVNKVDSQFSLFASSMFGGFLIYLFYAELSFQVEVEFANGSVFNLSAEFLRVHSPAVDSKIRSVGGEKVIFGRRYVGIMSAEPVGNYGIRIVFDDLHKTGIYTWNYFYHLGSNKFTLMRNYIKTLKKHGLSRDPPRRK